MYLFVNNILVSATTSIFDTVCAVLGIINIYEQIIRVCRIISPFIKDNLHNSVFD